MTGLVLFQMALGGNPPLTHKYGGNVMGEYNGVIGGVSSIVTDGFQPWWYGCEGTIDPIYATESLTADEAYKHVLDWQVEKRPIYVDTADGLIEDPDHIAVVRMDQSKILGVHSDTYGETQNSVLRDFGNAMQDASRTLGYTADVYVKSAGALFEDKVAWMLFKIGATRRIGDSNLDSYLLAASSHDGSLALSARETNVCVECMNTFDWAIKGTSALVSLRHTSRVSDYIADAKKAITQTYDRIDAMDREIAELYEQEYSRTQYREELVSTLVGDAPDPSESKRSFGMWERKRDGLLLAYDRDDQQNINGTAWGAVMAVNSFELWHANVRGSSRLESQAKKALSGSFPLTQLARELVAA